jgi:hypothetical protein
MKKSQIIDVLMYLSHQTYEFAVIHSLDVFTPRFGANENPSKALRGYRSEK